MILLKFNVNTFAALLPFGADGRSLMSSENKLIELTFPNLAVRLSPELIELLTGLLAILPGAR